jgi:hypothetical protein
MLLSHTLSLFVLVCVRTQRRSSRMYRHLQQRHPRQHQQHPHCAMFKTLSEVCRYHHHHDITNDVTSSVKTNDRCRSRDKEKKMSNGGGVVREREREREVPACVRAMPGCDCVNLVVLSLPADLEFEFELAKIILTRPGRTIRQHRHPTSTLHNNDMSTVV